jgi:hypothetical protein
MPNKKAFRSIQPTAEDKANCDNILGMMNIFCRRGNLITVFGFRQAWLTWQSEN